MGPGSIRHRAYATLASAILLLGTLILLQAPPGATAQAGAPHGSIVITGDADLCDDEDHDGKVGQDDGIVNCAEADGSAQRPYIIRGWTIDIGGSNGEPTPRCETGQGGMDCLAACDPASPPAPISICQTRLHLRLEKVGVRTAALASDPVTAPPSAPPAISLYDVQNLTLAETTAHAVGAALLVRAAPKAPSSITIAGFTAGTPDDGPGSPLPDPLVRLDDTRAIIERLELDATGRRLGLDLNASGVPRIEIPLDTVTIRNGLETGMRLIGVNASARSLKILNHGTPAPRGIEQVPPEDLLGAGFETVATAVLLQDSRLEATGGNIVFHGTGIDADPKSVLVVETVRFESTAPDSPLAILRGSQEACLSRLNYNELLNMTRIRSYSDCATNVQDNWWGSVENPSPRLDGNFEYFPFLAGPLGSLPTIEITAPTSGEKVYDSVVVEGTSLSRPGERLRTIEATVVEGRWNDPAATDDKNPWRVQLQVTGDPGDAFRLWIRACYTNGCSVPQRLELRVSHQPIPPIAVLEASPHVASPGTLILLDGSSSYSPIGLAISEYQFDLGDGVLRGGQTGAILQHRFTSPQLYHVRLTVRDLDGVQSAGVASVVVNIEDPDAIRRLEDQGIAGLPGFEAAFAAGALLAAVWGWRRRG